MKLFTKIYLCIVFFLSIFLIIVETVIVTMGIDELYDKAKNSAVSRHLIVCQGVQFDLLVLNDKNTDETDSFMYSSSSIPADDVYFNVSKDGKVICSNTDIIDITGDCDEQHIISKTIEFTGNNGKYIQTTSFIWVDDQKYRIDTLEDIENVFLSAEKTREKSSHYFIIAILASMIFAFVISILVTRPINKIYKASIKLSEGDYTVRINDKRKDELGRLADTFDNMAESIEDKISRLEENVREKEDFIANFSHEIKTPMTNIIGYADMIATGKQVDEEVRRKAGIIMNEGMRLETLSLKLMDISMEKREHLVFEEIAVNDMFDDIRDSICGRISDRNINISYTCDDQYIAVEYDLIKTLLLNLIDNSIKAESRNIQVVGKAVLSFDLEEEEAIKKTEKSLRNRYSIIVKDDGIGISEKDVSHVKEAFFMVDKARSRKQNGAGLGLALCDKIAILHGGRLNISSQEGKGTVVELIM